MVGTNKSKKAIIGLTCLLLGLVAGVWLFSVYRYQWIYKVNSRYLTFTQPEMMQSLGKLFNFRPEKGVEQFIIFGGSASLHAINDIDLSNKLTSKFGRPIQVILVGYDDQQLLDTYDMVSVLPKLPAGYHVHIINTWSFWRLIPATIPVLLRHTFNDKLFFNARGINFLNKNNFSPPEKFSSWRNFLISQHLYPQASSFSKWLKYFFLDKLIKIDNKRYKFLFEDSMTDNPVYLENPYYIKQVLKVMHSEKRKKIRETVIKKLFYSYNSNYKQLTSVDRNRWLRFNTLLFSGIDKLGRKKGYDVITLELPIYGVSMRDTDIRHNLHVIRNELNILKVPHVNARSQTFIENDCDVWWDLVHMNLAGKKIYDSYLIKLFEHIIKED